MGLLALHRGLEASHVDLSAKHADGHQLHTDNYSQLGNQLQAGLAEVRNGLQNLAIENADDTKNWVERCNAIDAFSKDSAGQLGDQLQAGFTEVRNGLQNLATENAEDTKSWEERCNAIDAFSKECAEQCERLKEEVPTQLSQLQASICEQTAKMVEAGKAENAKKIQVVHGIVTGMQSVIESERMKDRESEEELMRTMQCDRDNVKRAVNDVRTELKRDLAKEHQDRLDAALEQRSEILDKVRGGTRPRKEAQGATEDASVTLGVGVGVGGVTLGEAPA